MLPSHRLFTPIAIGMLFLFTLRLAAAPGDSLALKKTPTFPSLSHCKSKPWLRLQAYCTKKDCPLDSAKWRLAQARLPLPATFDSLSASGTDSLLKLYRPLLIWAPDSSRFVDIYSSTFDVYDSSGKFFVVSDTGAGIHISADRGKTILRLRDFHSDVNPVEAVWLNGSQLLVLISDASGTAETLRAIEISFRDKRMNEWVYRGKIPPLFDHIEQTMKNSGYRFD